MDDMFPDVEVLEGRHEIILEMAMSKAIDRVSEHAERQHVRHHHAEDSRDHHVNSAEGHRRLAERKRHEHQRAENKARFEIERMREGVEEIDGAKAFGYCR